MKFLCSKSISLGFAAFQPARFFFVCFCPQINFRMINGVKLLIYASPRIVLVFSSFRYILFLFLDFNRIREPSSNNSVIATDTVVRHLAYFTTRVFVNKGRAIAMLNLLLRSSMDSCFSGLCRASARHGEHPIISVNTVGRYPQNWAENHRRSTTNYRQMHFVKRKGKEKCSKDETKLARHGLA